MKTTEKAYIALAVVSVVSVAWAFMHEHWLLYIISCCVAGHCVAMLYPFLKS